MLPEISFGANLNHCPAQRSAAEQSPVLSAQTRTPQMEVEPAINISTLKDFLGPIPNQPLNSPNIP